MHLIFASRNARGDDFRPPVFSGHRVSRMVPKRGKTTKTTTVSFRFLHVLHCPSSNLVAIMPSGGCTRPRSSPALPARFHSADERNSLPVGAPCGPPNRTPRAAEGHAGGDAMAAAISATLAPGSSVSCTIARFGSSEKQRCLIGPGHSDEAESASRFTRRIRSARYRGWLRERC